MMKPTNYEILEAEAGNRTLQGLSDNPSVPSFLSWQDFLAWPIIGISEDQLNMGYAEGLAMFRHELRQLLLEKGCWEHQSEEGIVLAIQEIVLDLTLQGEILLQGFDPIEAPMFQEGGQKTPDGSSSGNREKNILVSPSEENLFNDFSATQNATEPNDLAGTLASLLAMAVFIVVVAGIVYFVGKLIIS